MRASLTRSRSASRATGEVSDGPYGAIASIGMAEHVGAAMLPVYPADLFAL
jgi:hypothetical protein